MYRQWTHGAKTIDNIRQAVAISSGKLSVQHGDITGVSKNMPRVIQGAANTRFLQTIKLDHVVWKTEIYRFI
jgi:hypothetical protein